MICPICSFHGEPGPVTASGPRESLLCPWCRCSSRQRAMFFAFAESGPWDKVYQVGYDGITPFIGTAVYHDMRDPLHVSEMEERPGCERADLEHLHYADGRFSMVLCSDVLEHVRLYKQALSHMARVLRPGGTLLLTVPLAPTPDEHYEFCAVRDPIRPDMDEWASDAPIHADPLNPQGCRVYRTYGRDLLIQELAQAGIAAVWRDDLGDNAEIGTVNSTVLVGTHCR